MLCEILEQPKGKYKTIAKPQLPTILQQFQIHTFYSCALNKNLYPKILKFEFKANIRNKAPHILRNVAIQVRNPIPIEFIFFIENI